jgi:RNA polymerase sigma factor (sigma-70 family)
MPDHRAPATTRWSLILAATGEGTPEADEALASLCQMYWYPVYAFIRRQERNADAAADLTQEFFARLLEKHYLHDARRERGRFRAYLFAAVRHFLSNQRDHARALKRGGGVAPLPIDAETAEGRYRREAVDDVTPEKLFDRQWAIALLEQVMDRLRAEVEAAGKGAQFATLKPLLAGEPDERSYRAIGEEAGMSEGAARVAVHRLRRRYRDLLRQEIADIVCSQEAIDAELRYLIKAVS